MTFLNSDLTTTGARSIFAETSVEEELEIVDRIDLSTFISTLHSVQREWWEPAATNIHRTLLSALHIKVLVHY